MAEGDIELDLAVGPRWQKGYTMKKVAVILSGCGVMDGTEIQEACAALLALTRAGLDPVICAPRMPQRHVIDHATGQPIGNQSRDVLAESARIARGKIRDLAEVRVDAIDAVLLPGGYGAAKNLCDFAVRGAACAVHPPVAALLRSTYDTRKPIAAMCIAPVILARVFGATAHPTVTIGNDRDTAAAIVAMGARHQDCAVTDTVIDRPNLMVTTPAYMVASTITEVFDGAARLVADLQELLA